MSRAVRWGLEALGVIETLAEVVACFGLRVPREGEKEEVRGAATYQGRGTLPPPKRPSTTVPSTATTGKSLCRRSWRRPRAFPVFCAARSTR